MSEAQVKVTKINCLKPIANADRIELAVVNDDVEVIVKKGEYVAGDLCVYIPIGYELPDRIVQEYNLKSNKVKCIKMKGVFSEGLIYKSNPEWIEGQNVINELQIKKIEDDELEILNSSKPPSSWLPAPTKNYFVRWDFEDIKYLDETIFTQLKQEVKSVEITEKIHGSQFQVVFDVERDEFSVTSKGIAHNNNASIPLDDKKSVHTKMFHQYDLATKLKQIATAFAAKKVTIVGEVYGNSIQKGFQYDTDNEIAYVVFSVFVQFNNETLRSGFSELTIDVWNRHNPDLEFPAPKLLNRLSRTEVQDMELQNFKQHVKSFTTGSELLSGQNKHIREGVVVTFVDGISNTKFKCISDEYKMLKYGK